MENAVESATRSFGAKSEGKKAVASPHARRPFKWHICMGLAQFTGYSSRPSCLFLVQFGEEVLHSFAAAVLRKSIQQSRKRWAAP